MIPDHYQALGVQPGADRHEIRAAYRRLVRESHPDRRPGDPDAEETTRRLNAAWRVLGDGARRASYDRLRSARLGATSSGRRSVIVRDPRATVTHVAYSPERPRLRRAMVIGMVRAGIAVFAAGLATLLVVTI